MKYIKAIIVTFFLSMVTFGGSVYAEETQSGEAAAVVQTTEEVKAPDAKKESEEEPECD